MAPFSQPTLPAAVLHAHAPVSEPFPLSSDLAFYLPSKISGKYRIYPQALLTNHGFPD